jgi:hypothetical protein
MMLVFVAGFAVLYSAITVCAAWYDPATGKTRSLWQRLALLALAVLDLL